MTIQQFIATAIEGGWKFGVDASKHPTFNLYSHGFTFGEELKSDIHISLILLDPEAWKAVGKVKGWYIESLEGPIGERVLRDDEWFQKMHAMIDALCKGKTLEEYIATL